MSEKKEKTNRLKAGSFLLLGFFIIYIPSAFNWIYGNNITTDILRMGTIEESYNVQCLVVRDEVLLQAPPFSGRYIKDAAEGDRVAVSGSVATVLENSSLGLLDELDKKNMEIVEAQYEKAKNTDLYTKDISNIQSSIDESVQTLIQECSSNNLSSITPIRENINKLIEKRAEIVGAGSNDPALEALKKERSTIQNKINTNTRHITSKCSGVVSYAIDGCELTLTPTSIATMLPKAFEAIKPDNSAGTDDTAIEGKPFVKIIKGNYIYLATVMDKQKADLLKEKGSISIRINDIDKIYPAVIASVSEAAGGKCVITVKLDRGMEELSGIRKVNVDFIETLYEGLKIPLKCFKSLDKGGKTGTIVIVRANVSYMRTVEILGKNSESAIIKTPEDEQKKTISLYDSYIVEPKNIEEGQIINQ